MKKFVFALGMAGIAAVAAYSGCRGPEGPPGPPASTTTASVVENVQVGWYYYQAAGSAIVQCPNPGQVGTGGGCVCPTGNVNASGPYSSGGCANEVCWACYCSAGNAEADIVCINGQYTTVLVPSSVGSTGTQTEPFAAGIFQGVTPHAGIPKAR